MLLLLWTELLLLLLLNDKSRLKICDGAETELALRWSRADDRLLRVAILTLPVLVPVNVHLERSKGCLTTMLLLLLFLTG